MTTIAQTGSWIGLVLLLFGILTPIAALIVLPFQAVIVQPDPARGSILEPASTTLNDAGVGLSFLAWPLYALLTCSAFLGEMNTLYSDAGLGYIYITVGMPAFFVGWLGLIFYSSVRPARTELLFGALGAAVLISIGYGSIN
ncbi:hypothetical protein G7077_11475 [Sphingomonas piscis]|uniref:Uncharacterized protein n=1 Tax=Sphingomonas piscis TaxID=2714943 RepID=A0A6G7YRS3_9SPHN|nr:hypothetical protein [Sphingomonas piscis]QIK79432.1 hypothetical protein G7077_11475 [Sphingomonas piscis]